MDTQVYSLENQQCLLKITELPASVHIQILTLSDQPVVKVNKLSANLHILQQDQKFRLFESSQSLIEFLSDCRNFQINLNESKLTIKWMLTGQAYFRQVWYDVPLQEQPVTQMELVQVENCVLRAKIAKYEDQRMNRQIQEKNQLDQMSEIVSISSNSLDILRKRGGEIFKSKLNREGKKQQQQPFPIGKVFPNQCLQKGPVQNQNKQRREKRIMKQPLPLGSQALRTGNTGNMIKIGFPNGDSYFGQVQSSQYHGYGVYSAKNGTYQGLWKNGKAQGFGKSIDSRGNLHEGNYSNDLKNGLAIELYSNGDKYEGMMKDDLRDGHGIYWFLNGDRYEGQWKKDKQEGFGKLLYQDGRVFEGRWENDQKHGEGIEMNQWELEYQYWKSGQRVHQMP